MPDLLKDDRFCEEATRLMYEYIKSVQDFLASSVHDQWDSYYSKSKEAEKLMIDFLMKKGVSEYIANFIVGTSATVVSEKAQKEVYDSFSSENKTFVRFFKIESVIGRYEKHNAFIYNNKEKIADLLKKYWIAVNDIANFCSGDINDEKYWIAFAEAENNAFTEMKAVGFNNPTIREIFKGLGGSYYYIEHLEEVADYTIAKMFINAVKKEEGISMSAVLDDDSIMVINCLLSNYMVISKSETDCSSIYNSARDIAIQAMQQACFNEATIAAIIYNFGGCYRFATDNEDPVEEDLVEMFTPENVAAVANEILRKQFQDAAKAVDNNEDALAGIL